MKMKIHREGKNILLILFIILALFCMIGKVNENYRPV